MSVDSLDQLEVEFLQKLDIPVDPLEHGIDEQRLSAVPMLFRKAGLGGARVALHLPLGWGPPLAIHTGVVTTFVLQCPAIAISLDSTFIRSCHDGERHLEVRVGNVERHEVAGRCSALSRGAAPISRR